MKRLIKKSELIDGVMSGSDVVYIYHNPTNTEINEIKKEKNHDAVRGIISNLGDVFAWNGNYLHDNVLSKASSSGINIPDGFRFSCEGDFWLFDLNSKISYTDAINLIIKNKNILENFCPFNSDIYIIYGSISGIEEFPNMEYSNYADVEKNQIVIYSGEYGLNEFLKEVEKSQGE